MLGPQIGEKNENTNNYDLKSSNNLLLVDLESSNNLLLVDYLQDS